MRKHNKHKLHLDTHTLRNLSEASLGDAAGGISGDRICNFSDVSCKCNRTQGATCYTVDAQGCNSGIGMASCTC
jgi:hypothetical protein